jgi:hypothetical protein
MSSSSDYYADLKNGERVTLVTTRFYTLLLLINITLFENTCLKLDAYRKVKSLNAALTGG